MIKEKHIIKIVEDHLAGTDKFLIDVKIKPGNMILIFIDGDHGITLQDCIGLSKYVESRLDRDAEDFSLNVSSHGLDQPLKTLRQYRKNEGRSVSILMADGSKKQGKLVRATEEGLIIIPEQSKKKKNNGQEGNEELLPFEQVKETKINIIFKKP